MKRRRQIILFSLLTFPLVGVIGALIIGAIAYPIVINRFEQSIANLQANTVIYDRNRRPYTIIDGVEDRQIVPRKQVHRYLQLSVLGMEDARFFEHHGIDIFRIFGALVTNLQGRAYLQGASTVTQQLVKLMLLSPQKTLNRKLKEMFMAILLEFRYSKLQLLGFYLNTIYLGHGNYGVQQAALSYFDKPASELTLAQSAFLAGILNKPEAYLRLPKNFKRSRHFVFPNNLLIKAVDRQKLVLQQLLKYKWINHEEYTRALQEKLEVRIPANFSLKAPYFVQYLRTLLKNRHHLPRISNGGYKIYTSLDRNLQLKAELAIKEKLNKNSGGFSQAALVAMEPHTGYVRALVGGADFNESQFNRATQAKRQPGSAFKTILYATALENGYAVNSKFIDEPLSFEWEEDDGSLSVYEPKNFDRMYGAEREQIGTEGEVYYEDYVTLAKAFEQSLNTVAVQLLYELGIGEVAHKAKLLGLSLRKEIGLCLALGCSEVKLLNLTSAYTPFINQGYYTPPVFILKIEDNKGNVIYQHRPKANKPVFSRWTVHQMNQLLHGVVKHGTGKHANWRGNSHWIGGKTGTTTDFRDAWFIGYAPELITGVWIGNDDNMSMFDETGGHSPAMIWSQFMQYALTQLPDRPLPSAPAYRSFPTCRISGGLATYGCPDVNNFHYPADHLPGEPCPIHPGFLLPENEVDSSFATQLQQSFSDDFSSDESLQIPDLNIISEY